MFSKENYNENILCYISLWLSFWLLCRFLTSFEIFTTVVASTTKLWKLCSLYATAFHKLNIYQVVFLFFTWLYYLNFIHQSLSFFIMITPVRNVKHFLKIILLAFGFLILFLDDWRNNENLSVEICRYPWWPWVS
jgi:hypothetical protein